MMNVYKPGTKIKIHGLDARVLQVCISNQEITYEITYWNGNDRKKEWVHAFELDSTEESEQLRIGFKNTK